MIDKRNRAPEHGSPAYAAQVDRDIELIAMMIGGFALAAIRAIVAIVES